MELPDKLIDLYTYEDDLVLDPFMGSGSSLAAAARLGRRNVGYDLDPAYVEIAKARVAEAIAINFQESDSGSSPNHPTSVTVAHDGKAASALGETLITDAGFRLIGRKVRIRGTGVTVRFVAEDAFANPWYFDIAGSLTKHRSGMQRADVVWKTLGRGAALNSSLKTLSDERIPYVVLTTDLPKRPGETDTALRAAGPDAIFDVVAMLDHEALARLAHYGAGGANTQPQPGFWKPGDLV